MFKDLVFKDNLSSYLVVPFVIASSLILMAPVKSKSKKVKKQTGSKIRAKVTCRKTVYNVRGLFVSCSVYMQDIFQTIPVHVSFIEPGLLQSSFGNNSSVIQVFYIEGENFVHTNLLLTARP